MDLSRDHHRALVLARRCRRAADGDDAQVMETSDAVKKAFVAELEPHFSIEERLLLPTLASAGEAALVERTRSDHARLQELVALCRERDALREFGLLLGEHVRFEERELFPRAEQVLSPVKLAAVAAASAALLLVFGW